VSSISFTQASSWLRHGHCPQSPHFIKAAGTNRRYCRIWKCRIEKLRTEYSVSTLRLQCESKNPREVLSHFYPNGWDFLSKFYTPVIRFQLRSATNFCLIICNFDEVMPLLSATTWFTSYAQNVHDRPKRTLAFSDISPNVWEFLVQIFCVYYTFLSTLEYTFLFNYLHLWRSYAILSATTQRALLSMVDILSLWWWSRLIWRNFVKVVSNWIKICSPV